ncbi:MAG TPA: T9SS type A sorting domain-containing protein, partial [Panacibacter sp.]|nr:T9SS type A sorting domain-containing protein [Panacibacter sp.]
KVYPNPVTKGGQTKIEIKKAGEYSIQLLDNASKLLLVNEFVAESDYAVTPVNIPSILAAGIYYIRVIDERKKKSYVDKIVIQ